jgi:hypothetical protein
MTYRMYACSISNNPEAAMAESSKDLALVNCDKPQEAVDAARAIVRGYTGPDLPRAIVTRHGIRGTKPIFRAWLKADRSYVEERIKAVKQ